ncbi:transglutaminase-like domain-containing protein [Pleomorphovibrio marinus]|uniref:transglutaminase-like domain-containing protein n=1 Tax=Pleomorphovibrio marinus TaxID=2164132 RepID=UPI000E0B77BC|nr:transglutaminase domain-containing protein [Pleomorphovibrio marinus]
MQTHRFTINIWINSVIIYFLLCACGTEPSATESSQAQEEVVSNPPRQKAKISEIEEGIKGFIDAYAEENDGYFVIEDKGNELRLKLVRVHTEYLSNLGPERFFACVDLADQNGDVYDVDFFMEGEPGAMKVTSTSLHKLNGKPFYTWQQLPDKTWEKVAVDGADADLLGVIEGEDSFQFTYSFEIPEVKGTSRLWIPLAQSDSFQEVEVRSITVPVEHRLLKDDEYGNTVVYLELSPEHNGEEIRVVYRVRRKEKGPYENGFENPEKYLEPDSLLPVGGRFAEIGDRIIRGIEKDNKLVQARALYDYIIDNMKYMKTGNYGSGDANYACDSKTGNCTEFHSFFISLARSIGIPARFAIGASIPSERNEGGIDGYHCWAEFYAEEKWWPVDISEGNKYTALSTYYFGRHPANRIELSRGRDIRVSPGPHSGSINFLAYPIMEVESEKVPVATNFSFERIVSNRN